MPDYLRDAVAEALAEVQYGPTPLSQLGDSMQSLYLTQADAARIVEENPYRSYDQIAADTRTAEIVEMLRAEFQRFSEDSQATDYDLAMRDGWLYAADLIVSRFGGGES